MIVFMTDGQDTVNRADGLAGATSSWKGGLKTHGIPVTVHSVGFSQSKKQNSNVNVTVIVCVRS